MRRWWLELAVFEDPGGQELGGSVVVIPFCMLYYFLLILIACYVVNNMQQLEGIP